MLTELDKQQLRDEKLDPRKLYPCCALHHYYGPASHNSFAGARIVPVTQSPDPVIGCKQCWIVYYLCDIAQVPPSQRIERLEEMEKVLRDTVQLVEAGQFDYKVNRHAEISVEKDGWKD